MKPSEVLIPVAPSIGPAIVTFFGQDIPVLSLILSIAGLLLARWIAPPALEGLVWHQEIALTLLLVLILYLIVTGKFPLVGSGEPLSEGMAVLWGVGLGFSGLLVIKLISERVMAMIRAALGDKSEPK